MGCCERAGLLRKQEQETAHGFDLALEAVNSAECGAMASNVEVVCYRGKARQELRIDCHRAFDNAFANCLIDITRRELSVGF
jgi:hypothetical protein